jgi:GT2 family glycosyltransferase
VNKLGIGILNWNGLDSTLNLVNQIMLQREVNLHILIVDNGSKNSSEVESKINLIKDSRISFISNKENIGVARGFNQESEYLKEKGCDYICLLNNDTNIHDELFFSKLLNDFKIAGDKSIITPVILYENDMSPWYNKGFYSKVLGLQIPAVRNTVFNRIVLFLTRLQISYNHELKAGLQDAGDFISGCCITFHKKALEEIGLFDEKYFAYCEDLDFSLRAKEMGYKLLVDNDAILLHERSQTSSEGKSKLNSRLHIYMWSRNYVLLSRKFLNVFQLGLFIIARPITMSYWFLKASNKKLFCQDYFGGFIDGFNGNFRKDVYFKK